MSRPLRPVRGTHDWLADASARYREVTESARQVASQFAFQEIMTPIFEYSDVFHRTLGETSDVVSKETYSFEDRGGDAITLRPEFTAAIVRAFLSNGLQEQLPFKAFYHGPAFRYERPQKGRLRQFHQLGVEWLGAAEVRADIEVISMAWLLMGKLGLQEQVTIELNSLGDSESRQHYREALVAYLTRHRADLSPDSQNRLEKNPLRILDSKEAQDRAILADAPAMQACYTDDAAAFYEALKSGLKALQIPYVENSALVRGLDYYTHTVFEITTGSLGAQGTVLAGGRYNGLVEKMGGPDIAGIGFAAGIERLIAMTETQGTASKPAPGPVLMLPLGEQAEATASTLCYELRRAGLAIDQLIKGNIGKRMKKADKLGAPAVLILGEDELASQQVRLKDLQSGDERAIALTALEEALEPYQTQPLPR